MGLTQKYVPRGVVALIIMIYIPRVGLSSGHLYAVQTQDFNKQGFVVVQVKYLL